jgi:adenylylsulfate kinase-like enzyme
MYAKARRGELKEFTGVSDPYEPPDRPEIHLYTQDETPEASARRILDYLASRSLLPLDAIL